MKVVLSIKPQFANKIFDGTKKFEFRKAIFKNQNVTSVLVYASSPVQKVIGEFEIGEIFNFDLKTLWDKKFCLIIVILFCLPLSFGIPICFAFFLNK